MDAIKLILSPKDVAEEFNLGRDSAYALFHRPDFPRLLPEKKKPLLVSRKELLEFLGGKNNV